MTVEEADKITTEFSEYVAAGAQKFGIKYLVCSGGLDSDTTVACSFTIQGSLGYCLAMIAELNKHALGQTILAATDPVTEGVH